MQVEPASPRVRYNGCSELECSDNVFSLKIGKFREQFVHRGSARQSAEDRAHGQSKVADTGHAAHALRIRSDPLELHSLDFTTTYTIGPPPRPGHRSAAAGLHRRPRPFPDGAGPGEPTYFRRFDGLPPRRLSLGRGPFGNGWWHSNMP
jgi:hypothetical protein